VGLALVLTSASVSTALATDYAVGSDAKRITVDQAVHPGQSVALPAFGIYNKGTKAASYEMTVVAIGAKDGLAASWVSFDPQEFQLEPGEQSRITATIKIPSGTPAGTYQALLAGRMVAKSQASVGMSVGIGPLVTVRVASGWWLSAAWYRTTALYDSATPWSYFGTAIVILALAAAAIALIQWRSRRRFHQRTGLVVRAAATAEAEGTGGSA